MKDGLDLGRVSGMAKSSRRCRGRHEKGSWVCEEEVGLGRLELGPDISLNVMAWMLIR